uniref:Fatty acid amide hydrolase-like n=2 Tax=Crocodylus porosus TaxID=8502 RepID=A0A7M4E769_CROPO
MGLASQRRRGLADGLERSPHWPVASQLSLAVGGLAAGDWALAVTVRAGVPIRRTRQCQPAARSARLQRARFLPSSCSWLRRAGPARGKPARGGLPQEQTTPRGKCHWRSITLPTPTPHKPRPTHTPYTHTPLYPLHAHSPYTPLHPHPLAPPIPTPRTPTLHPSPLPIPLHHLAHPRPAGQTPAARKSRARQSPRAGAGGAWAPPGESSRRPAICPALPASPGPQQPHVLPRHKSRPRRCRAVAARVSPRPCALALPAGTMALALLLPAALLLLLLYLGFVRCFTAAPNAVFQCRERAGAAGSQPPRDAWGPRLSGQPLRLIVHLVNTAFGQFCLVPFLMRQNNLFLLRYIHISEDPTFFPEVAAEAKKDKPETKSIAEILEQLMEMRSPSAPSGFSFRKIQDYLNSYRTGELTPTQIAENVISLLEDCEKSSPPLRAIVQWDKQQIRMMAEASTTRYRNKCPLSPLDGIPVCVKEEIKVVPYYHRSGTAYLGTQPETEDATLTRKLREAGAVIIGVSNMHELGTGTTGCNPSRFHGTTRNPYNPKHFTGGSSSGSAAAVAAGLCPLSIGTDGGGSVRIPASFCGVVGLKGTFGCFSAYGCHPLSYSTVSLGPICASVTDAAIAYSILAAPDPLYPYGLHQPKPSLSDVLAPDLKGLKLGVDWTFFKACNAEILAVCQKAVEHLQALGATVVEVSLPEMEEVRVAHLICILSEMRDFLQPDFNHHFQDMNLETRANLALASKFTALDYIKANRQRSRNMRFLKEIFATVNCILTPATACTAPKIHATDLETGNSDILTTIRTMRYVQLANFTGIPGLVVPVGYTAAGLPINFQVMAKWWDEAVLLRVGLKLEQFRGTTRKPAIYYDVFA